MLAPLLLLLLPAGGLTVAGLRRAKPSRSTPPLSPAALVPLEPPLLPSPALLEPAAEPAAEMALRAGEGTGARPKGSQMEEVELAPSRPLASATESGEGKGPLTLLPSLAAVLVIPPPITLTPPALTVALPLLPPRSAGEAEGMGKPL